ncbi:MAG: endonuclease III [bacterium]|nr:endonuclease III [bacterium]
MKGIELLDTIEKMVKPLNPPVQSFEKSIRETPFRVLISVLISSRTKDAVTHKASEQLFAQADSPKRMTRLTVEEIEQLIFPVGFYKQKAKHIKTIAEILSSSGNDGSADSVPGTLDQLTELPGVGRKTGNLVLALAFDIPAIAVDIHVFRISKRLGWAKGEKPDDVEQELRKAFPAEHWIRINQTLVGFGQTLCKPIGPLCGQCRITDDCNFFKENKTNEKKSKVSKSKVSNSKVSKSKVSNSKKNKKGITKK